MKPLISCLLSVALFTFFIVTSSHAQVVDELRLGYDTDSTPLKQQDVIASPDGKLLAFVYMNDTITQMKRVYYHSIKIFDVHTQKFIGSIDSLWLQIVDFRQPIFTFVGSSHLAIAVQERKKAFIHLYDIHTKELRKLEATGTDQTIYALFYSPTQNLLLVRTAKFMSSKSSIRAFEVGSSFQERYHIEVPSMSLRPMKMDPQGELLSFTEDSNKIHLINISSGKLMSTVGNIENAFRVGAYVQSEFDNNGNMLNMIINGGHTKFKLEVFSLKSFTSEFYEIKDVIFETLKGGVEFMELVGNTLLIGGHSAFSVVNITSGEVLYNTMVDRKNDRSNILRLTPDTFLIYSNSLVLRDSYVYFNNNKIYDVQNQKITGYLYTDGTDNFCVVGRDGKVDGSLAALNKVYWTSRRSNERTYLERTYEQQFTPRLLNAILSSSYKSASAFDIDMVINKLPRLTLKNFNNSPISEPDKLVSRQKVNQLEIAVMENHEELSELRLFQNGKLIKSWPKNQSNTYSYEVSLNNAFGNINYFHATASTKSGVDTEKLKFKVDYSGASQENPKLYLLTIGINNYKNPKYNLNYAHDDADGISKTLTSRSTKLFSEVVEYKIRNDQAVKTNILMALEDIKNKSQEQDLLFVYYAGHGVMSGSTDENRDFYLIPHDVVQLYGNEELLAERGISASELKGISQKINSQKQIFVLDACQSAGALDTFLRGAEEEKAIAQLARSTGTYWITSTGSNQFAAEFAKLGHGLFTYTMLEGMNGQGDVNQDKKLTIKELTFYLENKVPEVAEKLNGKPQYPSAYSFGNDFILMMFD